MLNPKKKPEPKKGTRQGKIRYLLSQGELNAQQIADECGVSKRWVFKIKGSAPHAAKVKAAEKLIAQLRIDMVPIDEAEINRIATESNLTSLQVDHIVTPPIQKPPSDAQQNYLEQLLSELSVEGSTMNRAAISAAFKQLSNKQRPVLIAMLKQRRDCKKTCKSAFYLERVRPMLALITEEKF